MIWQAIPYIMAIALLVMFSKSGDKMIAEMGEITKARGSHPQRIKATLDVKRTQRWLDAMAFLLAVLGNWHIATLAGLIR